MAHSKTYAEFHYWTTVHDLTKMKGYVSDGTQFRYPDFEFKAEILKPLIEGLKSVYPELIVCEHRYF